MLSRGICGRGFERGLDTDTPRGYGGDMRKEVKNKALRRLKIIEGQIRGLSRMAEKDVYCVDVINQSLAIKQALSGVEDLLLEKHLSTHVAEQMKAGKKDKAVQEMLSLYRLSKKK